MLIHSLVFWMSKSHKSITTYPKLVSRGPSWWQQQIQAYISRPHWLWIFFMWHAGSFINCFKVKPSQAAIEGIPRWHEGRSLLSSDGVLVSRYSTNTPPGSLRQLKGEAGGSPTNCIWKSEPSQTSEKSLLALGPKRLHQCRLQASWPW